tara:strand:- start:347 stop:454 length:108 start_codon:yes stop_codon:yes gene_type:complete
MATTLDGVKSLRADIRSDCGKGWNLRDERSIARWL